MRRSRLCYRTEPGTKIHILLSVHGFAITPYFRSLWMANVPSPLWPAKLRSGGGMLYSLGHVGAHGAGALTSAGRGSPSGHARPTLPSAGHQGTARGFLQDDSWRGVRCGRFVSCRGVGARQSHSSGSPCRKWSVAVSGHRGRAAQGSGPIRAPDSGDNTEFRGGTPRCAAYKGQSGLLLLSLCCCPASSFAQPGPRLRLLLASLGSSSSSPPT